MKTAGRRRNCAKSPEKSTKENTSIGNPARRADTVSTYGIRPSCVYREPPFRQRRCRPPLAPRGHAHPHRAEPPPTSDSWHARQPVCRIHSSPRPAPGPHTNIAASLVTDIDEHVRHWYRRADTARPDIGARPATLMLVPQPRRYQTLHCGDRYRRSTMSPRYRPMQARKHSRNQSDPRPALRGPHRARNCGRHAVDIAGRQPSVRRYRADRYARRADGRYQCPGGTPPISAGRPGNRYRQSPGAAGSAIDIGCMASGLISMPSRVHAPDSISVDVGGARRPAVYDPGVARGCRTGRTGRGGIPSPPDPGAAPQAGPGPWEDRQPQARWNHHQCRQARPAAQQTHHAQQQAS